MAAHRREPVPVLLRQRVIVADHLVFDAERELALPIEPFAGLILYGTHRKPPGCDPSEEHVEEIAYDLDTDRVICYLPTDDYRPESSGSDDWTEEDVWAEYRDWKLTRDEPRTRRPERNGQ